MGWGWWCWEEFDGNVWDGMGWDEMGWDDMGRDGMIWDGRHGKNECANAVSGWREDGMRWGCRFVSWKRRRIWAEGIVTETEYIKRLWIFRCAAGDLWKLVKAFHLMSPLLISCGFASIDVSET